MSANRAPQSIDAMTAERLLRGESVAGHIPLARLLAAAGAPATPGELPGEAAATLAFRQASLTPVPSTRRSSMLKYAVAKFLTAKVAAVVLVTGGAGGVALAAGTGNLPDPVQRHLPGAAASASHGADASGGPSRAGDQSAHPLRGLCEKYAKQDRERRQLALQNDGEFKQLTEQVRSRDREQVDKFCEGVRHQHSGAPSTRPSNAPGGPPSTAPSARQGGQEASAQAGSGQASRSASGQSGSGNR
ncbi:MAG: hypothetical protein HKP61_08185 [Dactylosporangium sp.]|nr:hypothetical protein [Dactylosporangium sp.]NNJ60916.1 hypothetical protein [Dactylosporangium sp.]